MEKLVQPNGERVEGEGGTASEIRRRFLPRKPYTEMGWPHFLSWQELGGKEFRQPPVSPPAPSRMAGRPYYRRSALMLWPSFSSM